ncbi:MAG: hypothetical protein ACYC7F_05565 [Gemmatimonadaceae bacterium]
MPRPDEGLIHAWLDGQLPPAEAARVEELAATDPAWTAAVAQARGLVAASSRIVSALDHVPAGVIPQRASSRAARRLPWWTKVAAAVVVVAGGSVLVLQRTPTPTSVAPAPAKPAAEDAPKLTPPGSTMPTLVAPVPSASTRATASPPVAAEARVTTADQAKRSAGGVPAAVQAELGRERTADRAAALLPGVNALTAQAQVSRTAADSMPIAVHETMDRVRDARQLTGAGNAPAAGMAQVTATKAEAKTVSNAEVVARMAMPAATERRVTGMMGAAARPPTVANGPCYFVREGNAPPEVGVMMRSVRMDGDTVRLEPAQGTSALRAWVVWRDGMGRGAMTATADTRSAIPVVAMTAACPKP